MLVNPGDTVRFLPGREGTFEPGTELVVKEAHGDRWIVADVGRTEWLIRADRLEVVPVASS